MHRFEVAVDVTGGRVGAEIGRSYLPVSDCRFALVLVRSDATALVADGRLLPDGNQSCAERRITLTPSGVTYTLWTAPSTFTLFTLVRVATSMTSTAPGACAMPT